MPYLFSYGTLQLEKVQLDSFGRLLKGTSDRLNGYRLDQLEIKNEKVLQSSAQKYHPIAIRSNSTDTFIEGTVFELTDEELLMADCYEVEDYTRVAVTLSSGKEAWAYVGRT